jgi:hypothetical protein
VGKTVVGEVVVGEDVMDEAVGEVMVGEDVMDEAVGEVVVGQDTGAGALVGEIVVGEGVSEALVGEDVEPPFDEGPPLGVREPVDRNPSWTATLLPFANGHDSDGWSEDEGEGPGGSDALDDSELIAHTVGREIPINNDNKHAYAGQIE